MRRSQVHRKQKLTQTLLALLAILILSATLCCTAAATTVAVDTIYTRPGEEATARIMITNVSNLGVIDLELGFDPAKFQVTKVVNKELDFLHSVIDHSTGQVRIGGMDYGDGRNGDLVLAEITFRAVGLHGENSPVALNIRELKEAAAIERGIPAQTANGTAFINIPPAAAALSVHRVNNVQTSYASPAAFTATGSLDPDGDTITDYAWDFGDGSSGQGLAIEHAYASCRWTGSSYEPFTAALTIQDPYGLQDTARIAVTVYIAGDANGDGEVNILDAACIGKHWRERGSTGVESGYCWDDLQADGADLNNDGEINILDAVVVGRNWRRTAW
jgi:hypothetical protein